MFNQNRRNLSLLLLVASFGILGSGCGSSLENVERFGTTSAAVRVASNNIADDIYDSCLRIATKYSGNRRTFPNEEVLGKIDEEIKQCDGQRDNVNIFRNSNAILINYMVGLGQLASNDTVSFDNNLDQLEDALTGLTSLDGVNIPSDQASAGLRIARFIFDQLTLKFRKKEIKKAVICADPEIDKYTDALTSMAQDYYINGVLNIEKDALRRYYSDLRPTPSQSFERLEAFFFNQDHSREIQDIYQREQAGRSYVAILDATRIAHQDLRSELEKKARSDQDLVSFCEPLFTDLSQARASVSEDEETSKEASFSRKELNNIENILLEYNSKIQPYIKDIQVAYSTQDKQYKGSK